MANIQDYLFLSETAKTVNGIFTNPSDLHNKYQSLLSDEKKLFLRHFITNNIPFVFKDIPILFEQIVQYLADKLEISFAEIRLVGSAKVGFSMGAPPDYGRAFDTKSDLDLTIINEDIFAKLKDEFLSWSNLYETGAMAPQNEKERRHWNENKIVVSNNISKGFIDSYKIPNRKEFETTRKINGSLSLIGNNLHRMHGFSDRRVSARIYSSWNRYSRQLQINTESVFSKLPL